MKRSILFAAILGLALAAPAAAQDQSPSADLQILIEKIRADKKLLVSDNMELTEAEAQKFWPVYDAYQVELGKVNERTLALIKKYSDNYDTMTDATAETLLADMLSIEKDRVSLMQKFRSKFSSAIPARKVARYYQIEHKVRSILNIQLADEIPLVP